MHVHFGFDALDPQTLTRCIEQLRAHGKPLEYTVHDLYNPHQQDRRAHLELLNVLIPAADALITLTDGAAAEILRQWGRETFVLPHPYVVDFPPWIASAPTVQHPTKGEHRDVSGCI